MILFLRDRHTQLKKKKDLLLIEVRCRKTSFIIKTDIIHLPQQKGFLIYSFKYQTCFFYISKKYMYKNIKGRKEH